MSRLQLLLAALALAAAGTAAASSLRVSGFAQWELAELLDGPASLANGYREWPRIRLAVSGAAGGMDWKLEGDFVSESVTDAYLRLPWRGGRFWVGQFKQPFTMDALISDLEPLLIAPSGNAPFAVGRRLGLQYQRSFRHGRWQLSAYGRDLEGNGPDHALAARVHGGPSWTGGRLHLGAALAAESQPPTDLRFRLRPEARSSLRHWQEGGSLAVDHLQRTGLELGLQQGRWLLQSEWQGLRVSSPAGERSGRNAYAALAFAARGEPRAYRDGLFVLPPRPEHGIHSVELVLRHSRTILPRVTGGEIEQDTLSAGVNIAIARHWRLQASYAHTGGAERQTAELLGFRAQFAF